MKHKQAIKRFVIFAIWCSILFMGNRSLAGTLSTDIQGINESKYPGVKSLIQNLQKKYTNFNFQVYYTGIDWTEAITMEYQGHGKSPKNLFSLSNSYKGKWHCPICGSKTYDTGWYCASVEAIEYMMDPRNSLDETSVFQFKNLETPDVTPDHIHQVINNKYASYAYINNPTAINAIVNASNQCNLNGYSILAKIINEQGKGTSPFATGSGYNGYGIGYYNFFNIGAYGNGTANVMNNGLKYAINKGWDSVEKSILGGSEYYKSQYIGKGQNTLYYQRFNVVYMASLFSHQYQQDIMGAQTSSTLLKNYYTISSTISSVNHTFIIPLYENMPARACARPSTTENQTFDCEEATVLSSGVEVRAAPVSGRIISRLNKNEKIRVVKRAQKVSSDGKYWDTIVTNTDGTYGYVPRSAISRKNNYPIYVFDYQYYAESNPDLKAIFGNDENQLYDHFVEYGVKEGRIASPTFNAKYYVENSPDLKAAFGDDYMAGVKHFMNGGYNEPRRSSPEYDPTFYKYYYADLKNLSNKQLIEHYIQYGRKEGRLGALEKDLESILFDARVYAECNPDLVAVYGKDEPLLRIHWIHYGIKEGRIASLLYTAEMYRFLNQDLANIYGTNHEALLLHFKNYGVKEGRSASFLFEPLVYLAFNSDVKAVYQTNYMQAYLHYKAYGLKEGRQASYIFNSKTYINTNPDLKAVFGTDDIGACIHFINYGIKEPRKTSTIFDVTVYFANYADLRKVYGTHFVDYFKHYLYCGRVEGRRGI